MMENHVIEIFNFGSVVLTLWTSVSLEVKWVTNKYLILFANVYYLPLKWDFFKEK